MAHLPRQAAVQLQAESGERMVGESTGAKRAGQGSAQAASQNNEGFSGAGAKLAECMLACVGKGLAAARIGCFGIRAGNEAGCNAQRIWQEGKRDMQQGLGQA